jgi:hypothetical protein
MKSLLLGLAAFVGISLVAAPAEAKPNKAKVFIVEPAPNQAPTEFQGKLQHKKAKHQGQSPLKQAIKEGRLTKPEAKRLQLQRQQLHSMKQAAAADGVITPREHRKINKAKQSFKQNKQRAIHNQNTR